MTDANPDSRPPDGSAWGRDALVAFRGASGQPQDAPGFAPCPHLPPVRPGLDWRSLHVFRRADRGPAFYRACLDYAQALWVRGLPARALLCLDRAFSADLAAAPGVLADWPLPYAATAWIIAQTPAGVFIGNPRVHFQHYADRMKGPRQAPRQARAWACWALARRVRPDLPGDPRHRVHEPADAEIFAALEQHGLPGEAQQWRRAADASQPARP